MINLVTGASGYVGSNLVRKMVERGMKVRAFVRKTSNIQSLLELDNVEIFYGDITDFSSVKRAVQGCEVVFHLAALVSDWGDYQKFYQVNYLGTKNVLRALLKVKVKKFIHSSSIGVLDLRGKAIIRENQPYGHFTSSYCRTKAEAENLVRRYSQFIPTVIIRSGVVYGPKDPQCTLRSLNYARKNLLFLINHGKGIFPHVYIDNLIEAILLAAQSERAINEIFNITDGINTTTCEFFNYLNGIVGRENIRLSLPYPLAWILAFLMNIFAHLTGKPPMLSWTGLEFLTLKCKFDISKAKEKLGYNPHISLEEGMRRIKLWWDKNKF
ncbi:MAG: NAD-dependent epimerase/dehydratase family protein [Candidatus Aminicenantia bacterium]